MIVIKKLAFVVLVVVVGASSSTWASQSCSSVLRIFDGKGNASISTTKPMSLTLDSCSISPKIIRNEGASTLVFQTTGLAASSLRDALSPKGRFSLPFFDGSLRVESTGFWSAIPSGVVYSSSTARLIKQGHWSWHAGTATLRWVAPTNAVLAETLSECANLSTEHLFFWFGALNVQPGEMIARRPLIAGNWPGSEKLIPASCISAWSMSANAPAKIDPTLGVVVVDDDASSQVSPSFFSVFARIGSKIVEGKVVVYRPDLQPLVSIWEQTTQRICGDDVDTQPINAIQDLVFNADGTFRLTWQPLEVRYDFWGTYQHKMPSGTLIFQVSGGSSNTDFVSATGVAELIGSEGLRITGVDPGSMAPVGKKICAMSFKRVQL